MSFSATQTRYLVHVMQVFASFSFLGSLLIIFTYRRYKELRSVAFELICYMSVCDLCYSIAIFLGEAEDSTTKICTIQALIFQCFEMASLLWAACIARTIHLGFRIHDPAQLSSKMPRFHLFVWFTCAIVLVLPATTRSYGPAGAWCWIGDDTAGKVWRFLTFYIILWIIVAYMLYVYIKVYQRLAAGSDGNQSVRKRIMYYPAILIGCYFFATINRLYETDGHHSYSLSVLQGIGIAVRGFLNALIYGLNPLVRKELLSDIRKCCNRSDAKNTTDPQQEPQDQPVSLEAVQEGAGAGVTNQEALSDPRSPKSDHDEEMNIEG